VVFCVDEKAAIQALDEKVVTLSAISFHRAGLSSTSRSSGSISWSAKTIRGGGAMTARQACEIERSHVSDHTQV
jgi:hypothetical protein